MENEFGPNRSLYGSMAIPPDPVSPLLAEEYSRVEAQLLDVWFSVKKASEASSTSIGHPPSQAFVRTLRGQGATEKISTIAGNIIAWTVSQKHERGIRNNFHHWKTQSVLGNLCDGLADPRSHPTCALIARKLERVWRP